jgi:hypothetical protein
MLAYCSKLLTGPWRTVSATKFSITVRGYGIGSPLHNYTYIMGYPL